MLCDKKRKKSIYIITLTEFCYISIFLQLYTVTYTQWWPRVFFTPGPLVAFSVLKADIHIHRTNILKM